MSYLPSNKEGMEYAKNKIKNFINFFDERIQEYITEENYDKDLNAWLVPIEGNFFVGDNFLEVIENSEDFLELQKLCKSKFYKLSIYPHLPDSSYQEKISPFAPYIYRYSFYFELK